MIKCLKISLLIAILIMPSYLNSQSSDINDASTPIDPMSYYNPNSLGIYAGLSTMTILNDNAAVKKFEDRSNPDKDVYGGSYQEIQSGIDFHIVVPLDENDLFRLPIGIEYMMFRSKEYLHYIVSGRPGDDIYISNQNDLISIYSGIHYVLMKYKPYDVNLSIGLELKATYNTNIETMIERRYHNGDIEKYHFYEAIDNGQQKADAMRIGSFLKINGEGRLLNNLHANIYFGLGIVNLIGLDDSRGELLTPVKEGEAAENMIMVYQIGFQFKYRVDL